MSTAKKKVESLLSKLPDNCSLEDVQYHLYVIEKVLHGLEVADKERKITLFSINIFIWKMNQRIEIKL
mgnify:CR=1 FL=1